MFRNYTIRLASLLSLFVLVGSAAHARQYGVPSSDGRSLVAHTRLAPVLVPRAFPPFKGEHVYGGRYAPPGAEQGPAGIAPGRALDLSSKQSRN